MGPNIRATSSLFSVGLIDTIDKSSSGRMPNLSIASLSGYLIEHGVKVEVLDLFFSSKKSQDRFFKKKWGLVGITSTSYAFHISRMLAAAIKRNNPNTPIALGGAHASVAREKILGEKNIDFVIYGEGEVSLLNLVRAIEENPQPTPNRLKNINGLIFRDGKNSIINSAAKRIRDIDDLPLPPYDIFPMDKYETYPLFTSRGCPHDCVYCASKMILGRKWVAKTPRRIIYEIEYLIKNWGKRSFIIIDDTFNLNEERVKEFCQLINDKKLNIRWSVCGIRADKTDPRMLYLMKKSGCTSVAVGIESANSKVLKNIGKDETIEQIAAGLQRIKKAKISITGMFMIGNPDDTLETLRESIEFAKSQRLSRTRFYHAIPFPGTSLFDFVKENGEILSESYENFHDFSEEPYFETKDFSYQERVKGYLETKEIMFPSLPKRIIRLLKWVILEEGVLSALKRVRRRLSNYFHEKMIANDGRIMTRYSHQ
jgi:radical SAM superfamily enzyme YgiQ (UPF0313 family)